MRIIFVLVTIALVTCAAIVAPAVCPPDSLQVGTTCVDKYEASSWLIPTSNESLIQKVQAGTATLADLTSAGATQRGCTGAPYAHQSYSLPPAFPANGNWDRSATSRVYAVSLAGIYPSACTTWFQASQACALSGKRLLTNQEWQRAIAGTPAPGTDNRTTDCNIGGTVGRNAPTFTGARSNCVSNWGVYDMLGNLEEWVADWTSADPLTCSTWLDGSLSCLGGAPAGSLPGAMVRGANWISANASGDFTIATHRPDLLYFGGGVNGYRCGR